MTRAQAVAITFGVDDIERWSPEGVDVFYRVAARRGLLMPEVAA